MSELSRKAREERKAKADRLVRSNEGEKVDASGYKVPDDLNADVKTGERPVSRRQFKRGGKVMHVLGDYPKMYAGRKPRASGGSVAKSIANTDVKDANEEREGKKHVGGFKKGGEVHEDAAQDKAIAKSVVKEAMQKHGKDCSCRGCRKAKYSGGPVDVPLVKKAMKKAADLGVDPQESHPAQKKQYDILAKRKAAYAAEKAAKRESRGFKRGGSPKKADGGEIEAPTYLGAVKDRVKELAGKVMPSSGRAAIGSGAAGAAADKVSGRQKQIDDAVSSMDHKSGGRVKRKRGGRVGKTNINIIIHSGKKDEPAQSPLPPAPIGAPQPMPMPKPAMPPPGMMGQAAAPPQLPPGMMPRKRGGRVQRKYKLPHNAAGGGKGRLQKIKLYGLKP